MRRQFFLYNTASVLVALLTLLFVFFGILVSATTRYMSSDYSIRGTHAVQVQSQLDAWGSENNDWIALSTNLDDLGYQLHVSTEGEEVYSTLTDTQSEVFQMTAARVLWAEDGAMALQSDGILMVGRQQGDYSLVALPQTELPTILGQQRHQWEIVSLALLASGVAAVVMIFLLSLAFSHWRVKRMMRPVTALVNGARRVEEGDFTQPVDIYGQNEFSDVCSAFNQMQEHLLLQQEQTSAYEQARTDLVTGISHDLRTPLTSVKGYIKGLRDGVANTPAKQSQYLDVAYRKACNMDVLLQRLFYFSKMETGSLPLYLERTDLSTFIRSFVEEAQGEFSSVGGSIVLAGDDTPHFARLDTEQMYRVLNNLADNSLHYAKVPDGQVLTLHLALWQEGPWQHLRFSDNGGGIPSEQLPHLFDRFWRGSQARESTDGENSGLGLYIVKYIIEAHGGSVSVQNEGGLVYDITLPWEEADI